MIAAVAIALFHMAFGHTYANPPCLNRAIEQCVPRPPAPNTFYMEGSPTLVPVGSVWRSVSDVKTNGISHIKRVPVVIFQNLNHLTFGERPSCRTLLPRSEDRLGNTGVLRGN